MRVLVLITLLTAFGGVPVRAQAIRQTSAPDVGIMVDSLTQRLEQFRLRLQRIDDQLMAQMTTRTRDPAAMRQHVRVRELCASSDDALQHMQGNVTGMQKLLADPAFRNDAQMQQYVLSLSHHWNEMVAHLDGTIVALEQMADRLGRTTGQR